MPSKNTLSDQDLLKSVMNNPKYKEIIPSLVERIVKDETLKNKSNSEIVKSTRSLLHQIGGAYLNSKIDYAKWLDQFRLFPPDMKDANVQHTLKVMMQLHASSKERLPILDTFYKTIFADLPPISSILDLACGLNPLSIPWMLLSDDFTYIACDIYTDMLDFHNSLFKHFNIKGKAYGCDLTKLDSLPQVQMTFILKTLPCLEQLNKQISFSLLQAIRSEYVLVSFPVKSLSGREKGMHNTYSRHFKELLTDSSWKVRSFEFSSELAFLLFH
ncbi:MAG: hypothetical protein MUO40_01645 [Anaerolineaceae bacterium]|nr:hypothetical protein [Anaerolineaceae bacterium]